MRAHEIINEAISRRSFLGGLAGVGAGAAGVSSLTKKPEQPSPVQAQPAPAKTLPLLSNHPNESVILKTALKAGIQGPELAQFMAQTKHESWNFAKLKEKAQPGVNNYYTKKYDIRYSPQTAKILGNRYPGDGDKYHGRGFIQLTGRDNYLRAGNALGIMFVNPDPRNKQQEAMAEQNRERIETDPILAAQVTVWYWMTRVRPYVENFMDTRAVTRRINPAGKGLQDRHENFQDYMRNI